MRLWGQRLLTPGIVLGMALGTLGLFDASLSHAAITAQITQAGDGIELEYAGEDGKSTKEVLPLHKKGSVRYFSAGIGMEERMATYPPFPLKLVFVAGAKAYVTKVAVTITATTGRTRVRIPGDQVTGPWLFVDLPAGTYTIEAWHEKLGTKTATVTVAANASGTAAFSFGS